jgi:hypothetical protein
MTLFENLILFTNHHGNLQEMLEMAFFLKYVDLYLTSEWGRFYLRHPVQWKASNYFVPFTKVLWEWLQIKKGEIVGACSTHARSKLRRKDIIKIGIK